MIGSTGNSRSPSATWRSVRQHPHARTATRTDRGEGWGRSRSSSSSGRSPIGAGARSTCARIEAVTCDRPQTRSRDDERGLALDGGAAALLAGHDEVEVDATLARFLEAAGHRRLADEVVARPDLLAELHREPPHVLGAEPVGAIAAEDPGLEHPDGEHRRQPGRLREVLVVVDRVEVPGCALI